MHLRQRACKPRTASNTHKYSKRGAPTAAAKFRWFQPDCGRISTSPGCIGFLFVLIMLDIHLVIPGACTASPAESIADRARRQMDSGFGSASRLGMTEGECLCRLSDDE